MGQNCTQGFEKVKRLNLQKAALLHAFLFLNELAENRYFCKYIS
jgi:hypothetical protein